VGLHLISPGSAGLFHRAILQSGYASTRMASRSEAELQGANVAAALGCNSAADVVACMRLAPRNSVLLALPIGIVEFRDRPTHWAPNVDGLEIPAQPRTLYEAGALARVPVMLGATRDEGWTWVDRSFPIGSFPDGITPEQFVAALDTEFGPDASAVMAQYPLADYPSPKDALARLTGDAEYLCEAARVANLIERTGTPVYLFSFEYEIDAIVPDRVVHGMEGNFVFKNNFGPPLIGSYTLTPDDEALAIAIGGYWTRFAASGNPNTDDPTVVHWPAFKHPTGRGRGSDKYLILAGSISEAQRLREAACDFWAPYFFRSLHGPVPASLP
jgi:para-nitrobenzyl esterase